MNKLKLLGYRASHRNRWQLLKKEYLNISEFILFEFCIDQADFDIRHGDSFGTFEFFASDIEEVLPWSKNYIRKVFNVLKSKGLVVEVDKRRKIFRIKTMNRYVIGNTYGGTVGSSAKYDNSHPEFDYLMFQISYNHADDQNFDDKYPGFSTNHTLKPLDSYKVGSTFSPPKELMITNGTNLAEYFEEFGLSTHLTVDGTLCVEVEVDGQEAFVKSLVNQYNEDGLLPKAEIID